MNCEWPNLVCKDRRIISIIHEPWTSERNIIWRHICGDKAPWLYHLSAVVCTLKADARFHHNCSRIWNYRLQPHQNYWDNFSPYVQFSDKGDTSTVSKHHQIWIKLSITNHAWSSFTNTVHKHEAAEEQRMINHPLRKLSSHTLHNWYL